MGENRETKMMAFCCPQHGPLSSFVEYLSVDLNSKKLVGVPVKYCIECQKYYTPFTNLLAFAKLRYRDCPVAACKVSGLKGIPREEVRVPYFIDDMNFYKEQERARKEQIRKERVEKNREYVAGLRDVEHDSIILTNKPCFVKEHKCPNCNGATKKEHVKIKQRWKFVLANVRYCEQCDFEYITPQQLENICEKADKKLRGEYRHPFVSPLGMQCEFKDDDYKCLFIPEWALDISKYDHHHLPPIGDAFYDMSAEEYLWVKDYYQPEEFQGKLRQKSFLGEAGYSANESEVRRHSILKRCVEEYGKDRVIYQIKSNMNMRLRQKDGEIRYANALNVWRGDILFVENKL